MSVQYLVRADVVDITQDTPCNTDRFLVDSNIWLWLTYSKVGYGVPDRRAGVMKTYASFVDGSLSADASLCCCGLSLAELSHIIEKTEREIYCSGRSGNTIKPKEYRHNHPVQREHVANEIRVAWEQVAGFAEPLSVIIDDATTQAALERLQHEKVDGYDLFMLEFMRANGVMQVLTDDGDFSTVPGIQVFTANRNVIRAAKAQGKALIR